MDCDFAHLCAEYESFDSDEVAYVEEFFEYYVVEVFVFAGAEVVAGDVDLDSSLAVLEFEE